MNFKFTAKKLAFIIPIVVVVLLGGALALAKTGHFDSLAKVLSIKADVNTSPIDTYTVCGSHTDYDGWYSRQSGYNGIPVFVKDYSHTISATLMPKVVAPDATPTVEAYWTLLPYRRSCPTPDIGSCVSANLVGQWTSLSNNGSISLVAGRVDPNTCQPLPSTTPTPILSVIPVTPTPVTVSKTPTATATATRAPSVSPAPSPITYVNYGLEGFITDKDNYLTDAIITLKIGDRTKTATATARPGQSVPVGTFTTNYMIEISSSEYVPVGTYTVTIAKSGYNTQTKEVYLPNGKYAVENFRLSPLASPIAAVSPTPVPVPSVSPSAQPSPSQVPVQTLSASLANKQNPDNPFAIDLKATRSGNAIGTINYSFWYNCDNPSNKVNEVKADPKCGVPAKYTVPQGNNVITDSHVYIVKGNHTAKVIIEQGNAVPAEARKTFNVGEPSTGLTCRGSISADIIDLDTGKEIAGASVTASYNGKTFDATTTAELGKNLDLIGMLCHTIRLTIKADGYYDYDVEVPISTFDPNNPVKIALRGSDEGAVCRTVDFNLPQELKNLLVYMKSMKADWSDVTVDDVLAKFSENDPDNPLAAIINGLVQNGTLKGSDNLSRKMPTLSSSFSKTLNNFQNTKVVNLSLYDSTRLRLANATDNPQLAARVLQPYFKRSIDSALTPLKNYALWQGANWILADPGIVVGLFDVMDKTNAVIDLASWKSSHGSQNVSFMLQPKYNGLNVIPALSLTGAFNVRDIAVGATASYNTCQIGVGGITRGSIADEIAWSLKATSTRNSNLNFNVNGSSGNINSMDFSYTIPLD